MSDESQTESDDDAEENQNWTISLGFRSAAVAPQPESVRVFVPTSGMKDRVLADGVSRATYTEGFEVEVVLPEELDEPEITIEERVVPSEKRFGRPTTAFDVYEDERTDHDSVPLPRRRIGTASTLEAAEGIGRAFTSGYIAGQTAAFIDGYVSGYVADMLDE